MYIFIHPILRVELISNQIKFFTFFHCEEFLFEFPILNHTDSILTQEFDFYNDSKMLPRGDNQSIFDIIEFHAKYSISSFNS